MTFTNPKHLKFCQEFVKEFDFAKACELARVKPSVMMAYLYDETSQVHQFLDEAVETFKVRNRYITTEVIKYQLGKIVLGGEPTHKIQAAKLLLGVSDTEDSSKAFDKLALAICRGAETEQKEAA